MIEEELSAEGGLDYGALRLAIEMRDPDLLLGFYSEAVELRVVNAAFPEGVGFVESRRHFHTTSSTTAKPRAWHSFTKRLKSANAPKEFCAAKR